MSLHLGLLKGGHVGKGAEGLVNYFPSSSEDRTDPQGCFLALWYEVIYKCVGMHSWLSWDTCSLRAAGWT